MWSESMKPQCCACKHICCNPKCDKILDCNLALEETGEPHCCINNFDKFELETDVRLVFSYFKAYCGEYGIKQMIQLHKLEQKEKL